MWSSGGPAAGTIGALAVDAVDTDTVYAAGFAALYRSDDRGGAWARVATGLGFVWSLEADPAQAGVLYAVAGASVYRSRDGAVTWRQLPIEEVGALGLVPVEGGGTLLLAATYDQGVLRSSDGGASWSASGAGLGEDTSTAYWFGSSRSDPSVAYTLAGQRLYRSDDQARSWAPVAVPVEGGYYAGRAVDPVDPRILFLADSSLVYRSEDGGETWAIASDGLPTAVPDSYGYIVALLGSRAAPAVLYAQLDSGLYRSADRGRHWELARRDSSFGFGFGPLVVDPLDAGRLYWASPSGVYRSDDAGTTFAGISVGLPGSATQAVAAAGDRVVAGLVFGGVSVSDDGGRSWSLAQGQVGTESVLSLVIDGERAYAGTYSGLVYRSADAGRTWAWSRSNLPRGSVWALTTGQGGAVIAGTELGLFRSVDGGGNWQPGRGLPNTGVRTVASSGAVVYAGLDHGGVWVSRDGGVRWRPAGLGRRTVLSVAVDPLDPDTAYAATRRAGAYRSSDGGRTWVRMAATSLTASIVVDPASSDTVLLATGSSILRSDDGGRTFAAFASGVPARGGTPADAEAQDPRTCIQLVAIPGAAYLATWAGVYGVRLP